MINVGDILNTVGVLSIVGDIIFCYFSTSTILDTATVLVISLMVLNIPHGTQDEAQMFS